MALEIYQAEPNRALYIVAVQCDQLKRWLSLAGIDVGDAIRKVTPAERVSSVWATGEWGQMIISPSMAADMLVVNEDGTILPLHQLAVGAAGRLAGYMHKGARRSFCDVKTIAIGSTLKVQKKNERLKGQTSRFFSLSKIEPHPAAQHDSGNVFIETRSGNILGLSEKESRGIK